MEGRFPVVSGVTTVTGAFVLSQRRSQRDAATGFLTGARRGTATRREASRWGQALEVPVERLMAG